MDTQRRGAGAAADGGLPGLPIHERTAKPTHRRLVRLLPALRVAFSCGLLVALVLWLKPSTLLAALSAPHPGWLALALALSLPQVALSAWRWRLTAQQLGVPLGFRTALAEYYLATLLNQLLPGGVMGDANRAWRHARTTTGTAGRGTSAWHAVLIERVSGQFALLLVALLALVTAPSLRAALARVLDSDSSAAGSMTTFAMTTLIAALMALTLGWLWWRRRPAVLASLTTALRQALFAREVLLKQLLASLLIVVSYVAVYLCCLLMLGSATHPGEALPLIPWVLLAMALPLSIAGWGVREGAAALLWSAAGLDPAQGVAIAIAYGVVVLLSSLPGALVLFRQRR